MLSRKALLPAAALLVALLVALLAIATPGSAHNGADAALAALEPAAAPSSCHEPRGAAVAAAGQPAIADTASVFEKRGVSCALAGDFRPAIAQFDESIRRSPWRPQAYANRGQAYAGLGEYEFAVLDYDDAIRLAPQEGGYRYLRAVSLAAIGRAEQAVYDLEKVLMLRDPKVVTELQRYLAIKGFDPGPIDGLYGPSTRRALVGCVSERCFSF